MKAETIVRSVIVGFAGYAAGSNFAAGYVLAGVIWSLIVVCNLALYGIAVRRGRQ